jgi:integrase
MGTIQTRKRKDGSVGYTATVRVKRGGVIVHRENATFDREAAANAWMKKRETELAQPGALDKPDDPPLADVIDTYNREKLKAHGKTKAQVLRTIKASSLGAMKCSSIGSAELVAYAKSLTASPQTVGNYMAHLAAVFAVARPAWGYPLDVQAIQDARTVLKKLGRITRSKERNRRPTLDELDKLMRHYALAEAKRKDTIPMRRIILFAIFSARRQEEITRVHWADLDRERMELLVRDMKNPGEKIGNDVRTTLTPEALRLIDTQPAGDGLIWPFNAESISTSFTRACQLLGIEDLHFHDLRHEGISRLFELGWNIPQVAGVSGHRTWQSLKRYTHLRASGDKYAGWPWLDALAPVHSDSQAKARPPSS